MPLKLYNTFSKQEEEFIPAEPGIVRMYTCGPTVYGRPHIGNYASFLMADLLRRWLEVGHGYKVLHVKNITDVGHLVADADTGEDKVEKEAKRIAKEKRGEDAEVTMADVLAVAQMYTDQYLADEQTLNMLEPYARPKATETIPEMIAMIAELIAKGHAYETEDGVYYAVTSFPAYGKLSGNTLENLSAGSRVSVDEKKKHPADFALWKKCVGFNAHHVLRWNSPWGEGFPGWHIECSAMSMKHLGETLDIHTGGEDNIFPHHECEIAQSEGCGSHPFVRTWVHRRRIDIGDQKMSKSLGNVLSISNIQERGFSAQDLRYYLLSVHYRTNLKFSDKGLDDAKKARRRIAEFLSVLASVRAESRTASGGTFSSNDVQGFQEKFSAALDEDLNVSGALGVVFDCLSALHQKTPENEEAHSSAGRFANLLRETFGCFEPEQLVIPVEVQALVAEREQVRKQKDFAGSDRLRDAIAALGYGVKDTAEGTVVSKL